MWKKEYLVSLRQLLSYHKFGKGQIHHTPGLGQVILIKEGNIARGMWNQERIGS